MVKVVVIGVPGQAGLWAVDLENRTVTPLEGPLSGPLGEADRSRSDESPVVHNVNLAIGVPSMESIAGGLYE